jgi:mannose-6-phosphate isomerase-like protein (cupin superfamily)
MARDGSLRSYPRTADFLRIAGANPELAEGRVLALFDVKTPEDVHYPIWEMHPEGDELLVLASGSLTAECRDASGTANAALRPRSAIVIPAGTWHRLVVHEASTLIAITPRHGTIHKEM